MELTCSHLAEAEGAAASSARCAHSADVMGGAAGSGVANTSLAMRST